MLLVRRKSALELLTVQHQRFHLLLTTSVRNTNTHKIRDCSLHRQKHLDQFILCQDDMVSGTLVFLVFFFYLPEEHLAVLSREGWSVGRVTLLQHARLVGITSSHIAAHLPVRIIHWYTACTSTKKKKKKKHTQTNKFKFCKEQNSWLWFRDIII